MFMAYDTILQSEVTAELAVQNSGFEPYRYECICCGEEVFIAAAYSTKVAAYFRHRNGNNDVECENYLGQRGATGTDLSSRKNSRESAEFYYDNFTKTFNLDLKFSEYEIQSYEQQSASLELRTEISDTPFYTLKINNMNFSPDVPTPIPLNKFSFSYYLSLNEEEREHVFLNRDNIPTFFKILGNDNDCFRAKLVRSNILFTNTRYFVTLQDQHSTLQKDQLPKEMKIEQIFRFKTMNKKFLGTILLVTNETRSADRLLRSWGYRLKASESLTLLWPPVYLIDDVNIVSSDYVFLFTSFELQSSGNINVHPEEVTKFPHGISKIRLKSKARILKSNIETTINKIIPSISNYDKIVPFRSLAYTFTVPDDGIYYFFNRSGVSPLSNGRVVFLTPNSLIIRYESNYPKDYIYPCHQKKLTGEELLIDILAHYKRVETFDPTRLNIFVHNGAVSRYLDKCKTTGLINQVVMQFIEGGEL